MPRAVAVSKKKAPRGGAAQPAPPPAAAPTPPPPPAPPPQPPRPVPAPAALTADEIFQRKTLDQLNAEHPLGDVFFDYDKSEIRADAREPLPANSGWTKRRSGSEMQL